jgi:hypothetical protein
MDEKIDMAAPDRDPTCANPRCWNWTPMAKSIAATKAKYGAGISLNNRRLQNRFHYGDLRRGHGSRFAIATARQQLPGPTAGRRFGGQINREEE